MLETTRLKIRKMTEKDAFDLFSMRSNPLLHLHTDTAADQTIEDTLNYIHKMNDGMNQNKWYVWAIELKESKKTIGTISLWNFNENRTVAELGFGIHPDLQNQGYMSEVLNSLCRHLFDTLSLTRIEAYTEVSNIPCQKLLRRCGFCQTGTVDDPGFIQNRTFHMMIYTKTNSSVI